MATISAAMTTNAFTCGFAGGFRLDVGARAGRGAVAQTSSSMVLTIADAGITPATNTDRTARPPMA